MHDVQHRRGLWVLATAALAVLLAACRQADTPPTPGIRSTRASPPNADTALSLVNRFIVAESLGDWWAADSLVAWRHCDRHRATDSLLVTTAIQARPTGPVGDSALVQVVYEVVGRVWLADPPIIGPQRTRFAARGSSDTVIYRVFADSTEHLRMACGDFHQNHVAVSQLQDFVKRFDDSALAAWKALGVP